MTVLNNECEQLNLLSEESISVDLRRCITFRNRNAKCHRCADVCVSGCIEYKDEAFSVHPELCVGCGTCATVCPTAALEILHPDDESLYRSIVSNTGERKHAVIACDEANLVASGSSDKVDAYVRCLGRVDECLLISLAASGLEKATLKCGDCANCSLKNGANVAKAVSDTANKVLAAWGYSDFCEVLVSGQECGIENAPSGSSPSVRRDSSDSVICKTSENRRIAEYDSVGSDGTLSHLVPERRERLVSALHELGEPIFNQLDVSLFGDISIDMNACISCQMCAVFCPTAAIRKIGDYGDEEFGVTHSVDECVKCRCCEQICHVDALKVIDSVTTKDIVTGATKRYLMRPRKVRPDDPHRTMHVMRERLGVEQVYER